MSSNPDRRPELPSWSKQYLDDIASVDTTFADAGRKLVDLLPRRFERYPASFRVQRGRKVSAMEGSSLFRRAWIEMTANASEVVSAPEAMQRFFPDLGVQEGDEIAIGLLIAKRSWRAEPQKYAENVYEVTLMPVTYRPDLLGVEFNCARQLWFLKSGTPVDRTEAALMHENERLRGIDKVYYLLRDGMVYGSQEIGTHGGATRFLHKEHPYLAAIHRGAADWITALVDSKMDNYPWE
ncbi:hypothetical protein HYW41_04675 [Candidatus Daviesbacteria bacterium]|nr:hypothetical protein [Candidatus Daviesbacteria bacterium]